MRHLLSGCTALLAASALAQDQLPDGLTRVGNTVMMQPVSDTNPPDSDLPEDADASTELRSGNYRILSPADHDLFSKAFAAGDRNDWRSARSMAAQGHDGLAAKLLEWRYLTDRNSGAAFDEIDAFLRANPDWPSRDSLFARAEAKRDFAASPVATISWFASHEPITAIGKVKLGLAELAAGKREAGTRHLREGWIDGSFDTATELLIVRKGGGVLTPAVDAARLDSLIWREDMTSAKRQMARVQSDTARIAGARIALRKARGKADRIVSELPADLANDPTLQFDLARSLRRSGDTKRPAIILGRIKLAEIAKEHPDALWREESIAIRQLLRDGNAKAAYALARGAGFVPGPRFNADSASGQGTEYSESQFLAGWIALRFLNDARTALIHFERFSANVSRPISAARGDYWQGRAREAMGDMGAAHAAFSRAAKHTETFYGQLALARIDDTPTLRIRETPAGAAFPGMDKDELIRAMRILADLGEQAYLRRFVLHYQTRHPEPGTAKKLAALLNKIGYLPVAVRLAKTASYDEVDFPAYSHPVIAVPAFRGNGTAPEKALVLALIRQETEFDPAAVSRAGARGLMQIMPATARRLSRTSDLPFRPNDLTTDPTYNMQLGMAEYAGYLSDWNGNLALAAAAYNAGPNAAARWVAQFGDPRHAETDPVDWIEQITYGETRNYVQRVLENVQVYRARLNGGAAPLRIMKDLYGDNPAPKAIRPPPPPPAAPAPAPEPKPKAKRRGR